MQAKTLVILAIAAAVIAASIAITITESADARGEKKVKDITCEQLNTAFVELARYHEPHPPSFFGC